MCHCIVFRINTHVLDKHYALFYRATRLIELMRENAWMVDKSDPKYKNRDKKAEKWEEIAAILGEEGK